MYCSNNSPTDSPSTILMSLQQYLNKRKLLLSTHIYNIFPYRKQKYSFKEFHKIFDKASIKFTIEQLEKLFKALASGSEPYVYEQTLKQRLENLSSNAQNASNHIFQGVVIIEQEQLTHPNPLKGQKKQDRMFKTDIKSDINTAIKEGQQWEQAKRQLRQKMLDTTKPVPGKLSNQISYHQLQGFMNELSIPSAKQQIILNNIFIVHKRNKIASKEFHRFLSTQNSSSSFINLSDLSFYSSIILTEEQQQQYQQSMEDLDNKIIEQSSILEGIIQNSNALVSNTHQRIQIPAQIQPYFNYVSELDEDFSKIAQYYLRKAQLFIDSFNPMYQKVYQWAHIIQIMPDYQLFQVAESVHNRHKSRYGLGLLLQPKDITQGSLGDCYFLSALAAIVHLYPQLIYRLFVIDKNPSHIYGVKLFIQGIWKTIIVDGIFPLNSKGQLTAAQPHHKQIWVMLLQKAWAKVFKSYDNIYSGYNEEGLIALSGAPVEVCSSSNEKFLQKIQGQFSKGSIITCSTKQTSKQEIKQLGLIEEHAYTILKLITNIENNDSQLEILLKMRNPWGKRVWQGAWSFKSDKWNKKSRQKANYLVDHNDGTFFICLEDFVKYFDNINISRITPGHRNSYYIIEGASQTQFYLNTFNITEAGQYSFTIYQQSKRKFRSQHPNYQKSKSWLFLVHRNIETGYIKTIECHAALRKNNTITINLEPGHYMIASRVHWNYWANYHYTLSSYGPQKIEFGEVSQASKQIINRIIISQAEQLLDSGKCNKIGYKQFRIQRSIFNEVGQGIGFIMISNDDKFGVMLGDRDFTSLQVTDQHPALPRLSINMLLSSGPPRFQLPIPIEIQNFIGNNKVEIFIEFKYTSEIYV